MNHEGGFEQVTLPGKRGYFGWALGENPELVSSEVSYEVSHERRRYAAGNEAEKQRAFAWVFGVNS